MAYNLKNLSAQGPENIVADRVVLREIPWEELGLTLIYVIMAGLWSVFSDDIFDWVMGRPVDTPALQALKGINFVTTTGLVLYLVLRRTFGTRRRAEEARRLSQQRFEFVALATTDAIWDLNLQTKVMWWSDGIQNLFGYRSGDVSTKFDWWLERLHPADRDRVTEALQHALDGGGRTWSGQYKFRRNDGSFADVLDRGYILLDAAGKPTRIVGGISDISARRRAEDALENSRRQLRALTARLQSGREDERAAVAREIHDDLGQVLTAIKINLDWLERALGEQKANPALNPLLERVVESTELVEAASRAVQRIATDLRPAILDTLGLAAALELEARRFEQRTTIACELHVPDEQLELPRQWATTIFRVYQEALTNVARHGRASAVRILLAAEAKEITLQVEDNGQGISPEAIGDSASLGLLGMRERAAVLEGEVAIQPIAPHGTRVLLRLPRPVAPAAASAPS